VRIRFNAHIRTIVVLTGGKLTWIYFPYLLSVMMHLHQGKKVSILVPGDVDSSPIASRRDLLEAVSIVM
jgi:phosphoribulokinase